MHLVQHIPALRVILRIISIVNNGSSGIIHLEETVCRSQADKSFFGACVVDGGCALDKIYLRGLSAAEISADYRLCVFAENNEIIVLFLACLVCDSAASAAFDSDYLKLAESVACGELGSAVVIAVNINISYYLCDIST